MNIKNLFRRQKENPPRCSAVIVAAGSSQRMGSDKAMMNLGEMPVIARTLLAFENCPCVDEIVVVTRMDLIVDIADICKRYGISKASRICCGGKTRMESALAGVSELSRDSKLIAIHDGARPLVTNELIERSVNAAAEYLAAAPAIPSTDTLKAVDENGFVTGTVDRARTMRVQTPQVFSADVIKGALSKAVKDGLALTDDCSAVEIMGIRTKLVEGDPENIKLTTPDDVMIAAAILKRRGDAE